MNCGYCICLDMGNLYLFEKNKFAFLKFISLVSGKKIIKAL